jgi:hypothetical protein
MKKVLEGEITSLAHSILKSKTDNVHELKEKAGLLYEKLCVLSFAEKHFAGNQPNIGKAAFKSAFEIDLEEINKPVEAETPTQPTPAETNPPIEKQSVSMEKEVEESKISVEEKSLPQEDPVLAEEISTETPISTSETIDDGLETQEETKPTLDETSTSDETTSTKEETVFQPHKNALTEEDFGVHFDELPDFEPAPARESAPKKTEEETPTTPAPTAQTQKEAATEKASVETERTSKRPENGASNQQDSTKPQRTMDLFSQDKKSLNDQLKTELKIGLNDRLAFIKKLFDGNATAYNHVMVRLNDFSSFQDAKSYLMTEVKPDFTWDEQEAVEQRFLEILEAKMG